MQTSLVQQEDRELRLLNVREGLPPILWAVLIVLGATIVVFTFFLGMSNARLHRWAVAALTVGLTFVILTIVVLDHPFGEIFRVGPEAFERATTAKAARKMTVKARTQADLQWSPVSLHTNSIHSLGPGLCWGSGACTGRSDSGVDMLLLF
jgi:hypothetical protein